MFRLSCGVESARNGQRRRRGGELAGKVKRVARLSHHGQGVRLRVDHRLQMRDGAEGVGNVLKALRTGVDGDLRERLRTRRLIDDRH